MFKFKAELHANYAGREFYDRQYPVMIICPNTVEFKDRKLCLIEDVLRRTIPHRALIKKPELGLQITKRKRHVICFQNPRMTKFYDDKVAADAATKHIYKIEMPQCSIPEKCYAHEIGMLQGHCNFRWVR